MAPATESIMSVVPREKAGAGAAVNNSVRQVGGALGVAILGSVLAASYSAHLGSAVDGAARRGPRGGQPVDRRHPRGGAQVEGDGDDDAARAAADLVEPAREAFVSAMHVTAVFTAVAALVAAARRPRLAARPTRRRLRRPAEACPGHAVTRWCNSRLTTRVVAAQAGLSAAGAPRAVRRELPCRRPPRPDPGRRDPFAPLLENPLAALFRAARPRRRGDARRPHRRRPAAGHPLRRRPASGSTSAATTTSASPATRG